MPKIEEKALLFEKKFGKKMKKCVQKVSRKFNAEKKSSGTDFAKKNPTAANP